MKKVGFIIPNLRGGGAERALINILTQFDRSIWKVTLFVGVQYGAFLQNLPNDITTRFIFPNLFISRIASYLYSKWGITFLFFLYRKKINVNVDILISFLDGPFSLFLFYNVIKTTPKKIVVIHSSYSSFSNVNKFLNTPHFHRMKRRYMNVDTIIAVSEESKLEFQSVFGIYPDIRVIYNPLNSKDIQTKKLHPLLDSSDSFLFLSVGSLHPVKGYDLLIEASTILKNRGFSFEVWILGEGHLKDDLLNLIKRNGLDSTVYLKGFTQNPYPYINYCDVFIMTSHTEGLPTVLGEAMIIGKPVLVTDVTGCREITNNGEYGLTVELSVEHIAHAMESMLINSELRNEFISKSLERSKIFDDTLTLKKYYEL